MIVQGGITQAGQPKSLWENQARPWTNRVWTNRVWKSRTRKTNG
jgi:hypothetical protein